MTIHDNVQSISMQDLAVMEFQDFARLWTVGTQTNLITLAQLSASAPAAFGKRLCIVQFPPSRSLTQLTVSALLNFTVDAAATTRHSVKQTATTPTELTHLIST